MKNSISNLIEDICESDVYIGNNEEYVILTKELSNQVLNPLRKGIIELLREQNPITERKLSFLFEQEIHEDLIVLNHLGIINIQKVGSDNKNDIITLNKNVRIIEPEEY